MTARAKLELATAAIALLASAYGFRTWIAEHDARIRAEQQVAAAQKSFDQSAAQLKQIERQQATKDAAAQAAIAKLSAAAAAQKAPEQITKWIPLNLGSLPVPIHAELPAPTPQNPTPAATFAVPQVDLSFLRDQVATCQENAVALSDAQGGLTSCQAQQKLLSGQVQDLEKERNALQVELKGGTFWHRVKHDLKSFAIGAAIGAVAVCASGHCK